MDIDYISKYLKYKNKYLRLKLQNGGGTEWDKLTSVPLNFTIININGRHNSDHFVSLLKSLFRDKKINIDKLILELNEENTMPIFAKKILVILEKIALYYNNIIQKYIDNIHIENIKKILEKIVNLSDLKECNVVDFMTKDMEFTMRCPNQSLVKGSCSQPDFFNKEVLAPKEGEYIKILELFERVKNYMINKNELIIVVGADKESEMTEVTSDGIILYITPIPQFMDIDVAIDNLKNNKVVNNKLKINNYFPLGIGTSDIQKILDIIVSIKRDGKNVKLVNKICGTCFRSFYYLKNNNISYVVDPAQC
jgi:hypothetical protein